VPPSSPDGTGAENQGPGRRPPDHFDLDGTLDRRALQPCTRSRTSSAWTKIKSPVPRPDPLPTRRRVTVHAVSGSASTRATSRSPVSAWSRRFPRVTDAGQRATSAAAAPLRDPPRGGQPMKQPWSDWRFLPTRATASSCSSRALTPPPACSSYHHRVPRTDPPVDGPDDPGRVLQWSRGPRSARTPFLNGNAPSACPRTRKGWVRHFGLTALPGAPRVTAKIALRRHPPVSLPPSILIVRCASAATVKASSSGSPRCSGSTSRSALGPAAWLRRAVVARSYVATADVARPLSMRANFVLANSSAGPVGAVPTLPSLACGPWRAISVAGRTAALGQSIEFRATPPPSRHRPSWSTYSALRGHAGPGCTARTPGRHEV